MIDQVDAVAVELGLERAVHALVVDALVQGDVGGAIEHAEHLVDDFLAVQVVLDGIAQGAALGWQNGMGAAHDGVLAGAVGIAQGVVQAQLRFIDLEVLCRLGQTAHHGLVKLLLAHVIDASEVAELQIEQREQRGAHHAGDYPYR